MDLLENSEIKRQPIGTLKRNSSSGKKLEPGGASYRGLTPKSRLGEVKEGGKKFGRSVKVSGATDINLQELYNRSGQGTIKRYRSYTVID